MQGQAPVATASPTKNARWANIRIRDGIVRNHGSTPGARVSDELVETRYDFEDETVVGAASNFFARLSAGSDWQAATWPYLQQMIDTGRFPMVARVVSDATHPSSDVTFERGLESVIEGIAARLAANERVGRPSPDMKSPLLPNCQHPLAEYPLIGMLWPSKV